MKKSPKASSAVALSMGFETFVPDARDKLIEDLHSGALDPEKAEQSARRLGLKSLTPNLDLARYDVLTERDWTLAMAVYWLVWACPDRVRDALPRYRSRIQEWRWQRLARPQGDRKRPLKPKGGWWLVRTFSDDAPLMMAMLAEGFAASEKTPIPLDQRMTVYAARCCIWDLLRSGEWEATTKDARGRPFNIPALEWAFLTPISSGVTRDALAFEGEEWKGPAYSDPVLIPRDTVLAAFPAPVVVVLAELFELFENQDRISRVVQDIAAAVVGFILPAPKLDLGPFYSQKKLAQDHWSLAVQRLGGGDQKQAKIARELIAMAREAYGDLVANSLNAETLAREIRNDQNSERESRSVKMRIAGHSGG